MKTGSLMVKPFIITESMTLTDSDSGRTFFLNAAGGFTVTLPRPRAGVNFEFIIRTTPTSDYVIVTESEEMLIIGQSITSNVKAPYNAVAEQSGTTKVIFVAPDARVGDSAKFISDGTYWYVNAFCSSYTGITLAEQSKSSSRSPSVSPSTSPSVSPSHSPSTSPSTSPSRSPSVSPSRSPSTSSSRSPSTSPSVSPSVSPSPS